MRIFRNVSGFIAQEWDTETNSWVSQEFVQTGDENDVEWNDGDGNTVDIPQNTPYLPIKLVQPDEWHVMSKEDETNNILFNLSGGMPVENLHQREIDLLIERFGENWKINLGYK